MENVFLSDKDVINIFKNHLKIESRVVSIEDFFNIRNRKKINFEPYYQRKYVWNNEKASYFIESILIGTEIPPLILFHGNNTDIEIVDGRQRFETIKNFIDGKLVLNSKGLMILKSLNKKQFAKLDTKLNDRFLDSKIRVIDFRLINEPLLNSKKEDLIKKEIFRRYNSGITPLRRSDVDKAVFIDDPITKKLKEKFNYDKHFYKNNVELFFHKKKNLESKATFEDLLSKIRLFQVLHLIPIKYYSTLSNRKDIMNMFYHKFSEEIEDIHLFLIDYEKKINFISEISILTNNFNRLMAECLFWSFKVMENEGFKLKEILSEDFLKEISRILGSNFEIFTEENSHFYKQFNSRYNLLLKIFEDAFSINLNKYLDSYSPKEIRENIDLEKKNNKEEYVENLFLTKPAPTDITIESIKSKMQRSNFLVRPIYQRSEVMNINKSSSLIESILLDIKLPPLFVFKNKNNIYEVVDGQQRILAILGFIGEKYKDETGTFVSSSKNNFKLKNLTIFKELEGLKFEDLEEKYKDKIFDFNLSIVEIDSEINENFNPIDLFIRLNSKPYPIRENTFEMWNSYADIDLIKKIKENSKKIESWFYIKKTKSNKRMENEELYTTLVYIDYMCNLKKTSFKKIIDFHKREDRINCRISNKKEISKILNYSSTNELEKKIFLLSIKNIESFISKVKTILIKKNIEKENLNLFLEEELNELFNLKSRRRLQNFYFLYPMLFEINLDRIRENRDCLFNNIQNIYNKIYKISEGETEELFFKLLLENNNKYKKTKRKLILNEIQKKEILIKQKNICPICKNPIFYGEEIEVDHKIPLSKGGDDLIKNLQLVHKNCNRGKGSKIIIDNKFNNLDDYLTKFEDENLEFKSTLSWNIKGKIKDKVIENSVLKTIAAFNNTNGGTLIIGLDDDKNILGLENDFKFGNLKSIDKFELHLKNIIFDRLVVENWYLTKNIKISFEKKNNLDICIIYINKGKKPIYTKDNKFYIRSGNSTIQLDLSEVFEYVKNSFEN